MAVTTQMRTQVAQLYVSLFGRAPEADGLGYWVAQLGEGKSFQAIAQDMFNVAPARVYYPSYLTSEEIVAKFYVNVLGRTADAGGLAYWTGRLNTESTTGTAASKAIAQGTVITEMLTAVVAYSGTDAAALASQSLLNNKVAASLHYAVDLGGNDIAFASTLMAMVGTGATGADAAIAAIDATNGKALTSGIDNLTATVFTALPTYTPGGNDFVNSLQDEDTLTGVGVHTKLNVTLGSVNDNAETVIVPTLNNIETVNIVQTGSTGGINFQDTTGMTVLNVNRITSNNANLNLQDLDSGVTTLSVNSATSAGTVNFNYKEEVLTKTNADNGGDVLNMAINSARVHALNLVEGGDAGADQGFFFEDVNVTTSGNNDLDAMTVQANGREDLLNDLDAGTTTQSLDFVANGTKTTGSLEINNLTAVGVETMSIVANARVDIAADKLVALDDSNDGITTDDLETLTITGAANVMIDGLDTTKQASGITLTVDAGAMTGNLKLGVATASDADNSSDYANRTDKDLSVTSGSGNDEIRTYGSLAGDISTGLGNDIVAIRDADNAVTADVEGVSTIDAGEGTNTVSARDLLATAIDNNQSSNSAYDDVTAAHIITGSGNDTVTVRDLASEQDWDNKVLTDANADDLYVFMGATVATGDGNDVITARKLAEGASINAGAGDDSLTVSLNPLVTGQTSGNPSTHSVLAADTDADVVALAPTAGGTKEVTTGEVADRLGAVIDMGAGTNDTATFKETSSLGANTVTIVGRDAELRGAETINVTALDRITVTTDTSMADKDAVTSLVQTDINANVLGAKTLNLTIANQIDAATETNTGATQNDSFITSGNAVITADVMRFDDALTAINLVSQEQTMLRTAATEIYEAGTNTNFVLKNLRTMTAAATPEVVTLSLQANEATGVDSGSLKDDTQLVINSSTGVVTTNTAAADVTLTLDYASARGLNDSAELKVAAASGAFDLNLTIGATSTDLAATNAAGNNGNAASTTDDDTMRLENFAVKFADANSHSINANGFGDVAFRGVNDRPAADAGDVSSTASTSFNVWSAAAAGKTIAVDGVNADTISVMNVDGTAVTAANVTLRVNASNNYTITTGSGTDVIDMRADDVRSDDTATALNRADNINAGTGRDTMIVSGNDSLGVNNNIEGGTASTIIDDDVFSTIRGVEKILVDVANVAGGNDITLDEQAAITGVDTIAVVGTAAHVANIELGNNFVLATTADNANGQLTTAANAFVIDASKHTGQTTLNIESKDDDTDIALISMDIRANADAGAAVNLVNTGSVNAAVELRLTTTSNDDTSNIVSAAAAGNTDGSVLVTVGTGAIDKIVMVEGAVDTDLVTAGVQAVEAAAGETFAINAAWTGTAFEFDASALLDTDTDPTTGGATITAAIGDTATLTLKGTGNNDTIVGGRGADVIAGNAGDDTISGDEVVNNNELEVITFAATYDMGDVVSVTHNGNTITATIGADGVSGAAVAAAFADYDLGGVDGLGADNIATAGTAFGTATSTSDAATRQLRLTGAVAGTDYIVSATTNNAGDNIAQIQTMTITDLAVVAGWDAQIVWNGVTYNLDETGAASAGGIALNAAVVAAGGTVTWPAGVLTITGNANGAALPLITQVIMADPADDSAVLALTGADLGTDQANPAVVTETLARTVVGGADTITGGDGNDTIAGLTGADTLDGGSQATNALGDTLDYSLSLAGVTVDIAANTASGGDAQGDIISNFENITGSAYNDTLTGTSGKNTLTGGAGNDVMDGGAGIDTLNGGVGSDTITGGTGNDIIDLGTGDGVEDTVVFASGSGVDAVSGFVAGTDTIRFSDFTDRDLAAASLLQQTAANAANAALSGGNTELLVVTGATIGVGTEVADIVTALGGAFDLTTMVDGRVVFSIQSGADTYVGYYTDSGNDDVVVAADIQLLARVIGANVGAADFWLPTV